MTAFGSSWVFVWAGTYGDAQGLVPGSFSASTMVWPGLSAADFAIFRFRVRVWGLGSRGLDSIRGLGFGELLVLVVSTVWVPFFTHPRFTPFANTKKPTNMEANKA